MDLLSDLVTARSTPNGTGYIGFASTRGSKPTDLATFCGIQMKSDPFAVKTGEYLLQRHPRLFLANGEFPDIVIGRLTFALPSVADSIVQRRSRVCFRLHCAAQPPDG